ncbi:MAG: tRNA (N6-threonylcarbamoyladenosine(37)-N6)-methyltransferase TrmO [Lachnospiraceae bacterium]|nr:tRNA (N6-threonylcarbamoyladenosine(37)-N6)-methyltransferase TrmO [Lachnospiraceae bacterium]
MTELHVIAHIYTDFPEKFGIPRQSGIIPELKGSIVFEPEYRKPEAVRGLEGFDYIWLLWGFQGPERHDWSPLVRPPRMGGNQRMGVFATRSPFRPNPIGLSSVKLEGIELGGQGPVLQVSGIDMRDGTPVSAIKPSMPVAASHPQARGGFSDEVDDGLLEVEFPEYLLAQITPEKQCVLIHVLRQDPRPRYQDDPERIYGLAFGGYNVQFAVDGRKLRVVDVSYT